jgi:dimethylargininase
MTFTTAIVRRPCREFGDGLTTVDLGRPDYAMMYQQHQAYVDTIQQIGLQVIDLDPLKDFPDAHFVEDVAVVTPELAVITRPGAPSRQGETAEMMPTIKGFRPLACIEPPGSLEGGDVLLVERHFYIGLSDRTNEMGAEQLGRFMEPYGYTWSTVKVGEGLHLKSSVNYVGDRTLVVTADFADNPQFNAFKKIVLDPDEIYAANSLLVNDTLLMPKGFSKVKAQFAVFGREIIELDMSESQKMDGGLTCLSLRF